jgi:hypothetical protein
LYRSEDFVAAADSQHGRAEQEHVYIPTHVGDQSTITLNIPATFHLQDWLIFRDDSDDDLSSSSATQFRNHQSETTATTQHQQQSVVVNVIDATTPEDLQSRASAAAHFPFVVERVFFEYSPILRNELFFAALCRLQATAREEVKRKRLDYGKEESQNLEQTKKVVDVNSSLDLKSSRMANSSQEGSQSESETAREKSVVTMIGSQDVSLRDAVVEDVESTLRKNQPQLLQKEPVKSDAESAVDVRRKQGLGLALALETPLLNFPKEYEAFLVFLSLVFALRIYFHCFSC